MRKAHLIREGLTACDGSSGGEGYFNTLCGDKVYQYKDQHYFFTPTMAQHRKNTGHQDYWCRDCVERAGLTDT